MPRVSYAVWQKMTPAQQARQRAAVNKPRRKTYRAAGSGRISRGAGPQLGTTIVSNNMPIFAARTTRNLRYSDSFQLTTTAGAVSSYVFAVNGMYDPNITGTGHQPMGFDQMLQFYNHYAVRKARVILVAANASSTPCQLVLRQDGAATPLTVIDRIIEMGGNAYTHLDTTGTTNAQKELKLSLDIAKLQGVTQSALTSDATLRGDATANPTELTYAHIQLFSAAGFTAIVNFDIIIEFTADFFEPRDNIAS